MKKFNLIETMDWKTYELEVFEVVNKPYLLVRLWRVDDSEGIKKDLLGQFFSSPQKWGYRVEQTLKRIEGR